MILRSKVTQRNTNRKNQAAFFMLFNKTVLTTFQPSNLEKAIGATFEKIALLLPEEYLYRHTRKVKVFAKFIFDETLIGLFDVLGQVTEKGKHR